MTLENRRLAWQQPIQAKQTDRVVFSFEQFVNALGDYSVKNQDTNFTDSAYLDIIGGVIRFGSPFIWKSKVTIPDNCKGLVIDGAGYGVIPNVNGLSMFTLNTANCLTLRNLIGSGDSTTLEWNTIVDCSSGAGNISRLSILNCVFDAKVLLTIGASHSGKFNKIIGNAISNSGATTYIDLEATASTVISGNSFDSSSSNAIVVGAGSNKNAIIGNVLRTNGINVANTNNTVVGNTDAGVITSGGGTNQIGLNT